MIEGEKTFCLIEKANMKEEIVLAAKAELQKEQFHIESELYFTIPHKRYFFPMLYLLIAEQNSFLFKKHQKIFGESEEIKKIVEKVLKQNSQPIICITQHLRQKIKILQNYLTLVDNITNKFNENHLKTIFLYRKDMGLAIFQCEIQAQKIHFVRHKYQIQKNQIPANKIIVFSLSDKIVIGAFSIKKQQQKQKQNSFQNSVIQNVHFSNSQQQKNQSNIKTNKKQINNYKNYLFSKMNIFLLILFFLLVTQIFFNKFASTVKNYGSNRLNILNLFYLR